MESGEWDGTVCLMPQGHSHETTELKLLFLNEVVSGKSDALVFPLRHAVPFHFTLLALPHQAIDVGERLNDVLHRQAVFVFINFDCAITIALAEFFHNCRAKIMEQ